jgi:hypothetical protein
VTAQRRGSPLARCGSLVTGAAARRGMCSSVTPATQPRADWSLIHVVTKRARYTSGRCGSLPPFAKRFSHSSGHAPPECLSRTITATSGNAPTTSTAEVQLHPPALSSSCLRPSSAGASAGPPLRAAADLHHAPLSFTGLTYVALCQRRNASGATSHPPLPTGPQPSPSPPEPQEPNAQRINA